MKFETTLDSSDQALIDSNLADFVPAEVYDIHAHLYRPDQYGPEAISYMQGQGVVGSDRHREHLLKYMPMQRLHALYFGLPNQSARRPAMNEWMAAEAKRLSPLSRALMLVSPSDDPGLVAAALRGGQYCGLKVYHCYSRRPDTMNAEVEEFAPEWMWELLHETRGALMLHLVRDGAIADPANQAALRRLCRKYPNAQLVLAHIARSFNYRNARSGLHVIADLDNAVVDTSAVGEADTFRTALKVLGPRRVLWGSDFPVSELRGRCVTTGNRFFWLHRELLRADLQTPSSSHFTLVGIEALLCLREACEDAGLTAGDLQDIFLRNALRLLAPHLPIMPLPKSPG